VSFLVRFFPPHAYLIDPKHLSKYSVFPIFRQPNLDVLNVEKTNAGLNIDGISTQIAYSNGFFVDFGVICDDNTVFRQV
jgi:hypothetical protein